MTDSGSPSEDFGTRSPFPDLLSSADVARIFSCTTRTVRNWVRAGLLHPIRIGASVYFDRADVERLIDSSKQRRSYGGSHPLY